MIFIKAAVLLLGYVTAVESISGRCTCVGNVLHCFRLPSVWIVFMFKEKYNQSSRQCVDISPNTDELHTCRNKPCQVFKTEQQAKSLVTKLSMCFYVLVLCTCILRTNLFCLESIRVCNSSWKMVCNLFYFFGSFYFAYFVWLCVRWFQTVGYWSQWKADSPELNVWQYFWQLTSFSFRSADFLPLKYCLTRASGVYVCFCQCPPDPVKQGTPPVQKVVLLYVWSEQSPLCVCVYVYTSIDFLLQLSRCSYIPPLPIGTLKWLLMMMWLCVCACMCAPCGVVYITRVFCH